MAIGDIKFLRPMEGEVPSVRFTVASGTTASIKAGEPVAKVLGTGVAVTAAVDATPVVGTNFYAGIAASTSTETATLAGVVDVYRLVPGITYVAAPKVAIANQAAYNALVGKRTVLDLTSGVWTVDAAGADGATNGIVIEPLTESVFNGNKVAFSIREGVNYLA